MFKVNNKVTNQSDVTDVVLVSIVAFETSFSSVCIVDFHQVNVCWLPAGQTVQTKFQFNDKTVSLSSAIQCLVIWGKMQTK